MKIISGIIAAFFFLISSFCLLGQEKDVDVYKLSLEELMNLQVSISTKSNINIRENPGIVTIITRDDIRRTGARDIVDLFHLLVPGFDFGVDVEGVVGMGIRGIWAHEGKYLFMVNGFEMNDGMFACVPFGNHFSLDNVDRIEIVRGPGSSVYGGFAGLGVINIITRDSYQNGGKVTYTATHTGKQFSQNQLSFGQTIRGDDVVFNISSTFGAGSRSDRNYTDYYRNNRSMLGTSSTYTKQFALKLDYKNLRIQTLLDDYHYEQIDLWDELYTGTPLQESFKSNFFEVSYKFGHSKFSLIPKVSYKWQKPWRLNVPEIGYGNNKIFYRLNSGIVASHKWGPVQVINGVDWNIDRLKLPSMLDTLYEETFRNGKSQLNYQNIGIYSQALWNTQPANFNIGARYDYSTEFGDAFVPRIGVTKAFKSFHFKLMASESFRVPGGILPNRIPEGYQNLKPEKGTIFEFESGYIFGTTAAIVVNLYDITFNDIIIYGKDAQSGVGYYRNEGKIGSRGMEMSLKYNNEKLFGTLNFASYIRKKSVTDSLFLVPSHDKQFLAFTPLRVNGVITYSANENVRVTLSCSYFGSRYAYNYTAANSDILIKQSPMAVVGFNTEFQNFPFKGFTSQILATNILNAKYSYPQPYRGAHGPLPGLDRSFGFRLVYEY